MANSINSQKPNATALRSSCDPFIIHLDREPYILSAEALNNQIDLRLQRSRKWYYPTIKVISLSEGILKLGLNHNGLLQEMAVKIEPDKLHVSCSCNTQVETLCLHTYKALERTIGYLTTDYFEKYSPGGTVETATKHKKYFTSKVNALGTSYSAKPVLGNVYRLSRQSGQLLSSSALSFPAAAHEATLSRETEIAFVILVSYRSMRFAGLIPCSGLLNKAGNEIKSFYNFLSGIEKEQTHLLTQDQQQLNELGLQMWKLVELLPGSFSELTEDMLPSLLKLFGCWEEALPLLHQQEFLYRYRLYRTRELKGRPDKAEMIRSCISKDRPALQFMLQDKGDYYFFFPVLVIRGVKHFTFKLWVRLFAIVENDHYLLSCLRDVAVLGWMDLPDEKLTVFRKYF